MDDSSTGYGSLANFATTNSGEKVSITSVASKVAPAGTYLLLLAPRGGVIVTAISSGSIVQLTTRKQYLNLWTVQVDRVEDGDCGSWIVDRVTGQLFGMLVATCEALREAYVLPVKDVFTEIETCCGHSVKLPVSDSTMKRKEPIVVSLEESEPIEESKSIEQLKPMKLRPKLPARKPKLMRDSTFASLGDSNFPYSRLQAGEIRIVMLLPGHSEATVQCKLLVRSINASEDYESLSYVWNRHKHMESINVNDQSIEVDSNLACALKDLRYFDRPRSLWVESLCVNQEDIEERNNHVSLLASIMARASSACIWLGKGDQKTTRAFSKTEFSHITKLDDFRHKSHGLSNEVAGAFSGLAKKARFHLGMVQAVCLARCPTIYCGQDSMPWRDFVSMISILARRHSSKTAPSGPSYHSYELSDDEGDLYIDLEPLQAFVEDVDDSVRWLDHGQIQRRYSLLSLVLQFSWIKPKIHHDAIYSMLPLANDVFPSPKPSISSMPKTIAYKSPPLQAVSQLDITLSVLKAVQAFRRPLKRRTLIVDYSQPFEHLCKDFVRVAIQNSQSLDILCRPWAPPSDRLPSWIADSPQAPVVMDSDNLFRRFNGDYLTSDSGHRKIKPYDASRLERPIFRMSNSPTGAPRISVEGFVLDTILFKQSPALMGNIPPGWVDFLGWNNIEDPPPEKAWQTLVGDRGMRSRAPPGYYRRACEEIFQRVVPGYGLNIQQEIPRSGSITQKFLKRVEAVIWGRRLIKTEKHDFVGLAPGATKKRDVVAILYGLSVPVVLRQIQDSSEGDSVFTMVGECFIYGMMNGEALELKKAQGIRDQTFMLI